ncbi:hypothetical protein SAMN05421778_101309 [Sphaerotilus natans]|uniref:hypothetical protein n=1 Tax=Sphaerotilus natans TaxID=34103 RepID=UPI00055FF459|nr:hypothetical protein [Sphaerotilus natans]SIQ08225.1 hypothetical protein SAMN05421778_101309 [Sphaerotilus natans]
MATERAVRRRKGVAEIDPPVGVDELAGMLRRMVTRLREFGGSDLSDEADDLLDRLARAKRRQRGVLASELIPVDVARRGRVVSEHLRMLAEELDGFLALPAKDLVAEVRGELVEIRNTLRGDV